MTRHVVVPVDDPEVTHVRVQHQNGEACLGDGLGGEPRKDEETPVPADDQLVRDVHRLTNTVLHLAAHVMAYPKEMREAADRVRVAFGLDNAGEQ